MEYPILYILVKHSLSLQMEYSHDLDRILNEGDQLYKSLDTYFDLYDLHQLQLERSLDALL